METPRKRKRNDDDPTRITYHAGSDTFAQMFTEASLKELKNLVRIRLHLSPSASVHLSELRDGLTVKLETEGDFKAFCMSAKISADLNVKVDVKGSDDQLYADKEVPLSTRSKKKRKKLQSDAQISALLPEAESDKESGGPLSKKQKVTFSDPLPQLTESQANDLPNINELDVSKVVEQEVQQTNITEPPPAKRTKFKGSETATPKTPAVTGTMSNSTNLSSNPPAATTAYVLVAEPVRPSKKAKVKQTSTNGNEDGTLLESVIPKTSKKSKPNTEIEMEDDQKQNTEDVSSDNGGIHRGESTSTKEKGKVTKPKEPKKSKDKLPAQQQADVTETTTSNGVKRSKSNAGIGEQDERSLELTKQKSKNAFSRKATKNGEASTSIENKAIGSKESKKSKVSKDDAASSSIDPTDQPRESATELHGVSIKKLSKKRKRADPSVEVSPPNSRDENEAAPTANATTTTVKNKNNAKELDQVVTLLASQNAEVGGKPAEELTRNAVQKSVQAIMAKNAVQPDTPSTSQVNVEEAPKNSSQQRHVRDEVLKAKSPETCFICGHPQTHISSKCPTVKAGIRVMRKRIVELENEPSDEDSEQRTNAIAEIKVFIGKKTKKPRASAVKASASEAKAKDVYGSEKSAIYDHPPTQIVPDETLPIQPLPFIQSSQRPQPSSQPPRPIQPHNTSQKSAADLPVQPLPHIQLSQKPPPSSQPPAPTQPDNSSRKSATKIPVKIFEGRLRTDFLHLGDTSLFTDHDLETIKRGSKVSLNDLPSSDSSEDESEPNNNILLEEEEEKYHNFRYPNSSDEYVDDEDDEKDQSSLFSKSTSEGENDTIGNKSFQEVNDLGSSCELDRVADIVVNEAVAADLQNTEDSGGKNGKEVDSDTVIGSQTEESLNVAASGKKASVVSVTTAKCRKETGLSKTSVLESRPKPTDRPQPMSSTPKAQISAARTRSQRKTAAAAVEPAIPEDDEGVPKPTPQTKNLKKTTELSDPVPSHRVIRPPASTMKTRYQTAKEVSQENEISPMNGPKDRKTPTTSKAAAKTPAKSNEIDVSGNKNITTTSGAVPDPKDAKQSQAVAVPTPSALAGDQESTPVGMPFTMSHDDQGQKPAFSRSSEPLFVYSETQQSFPYSQYPDLATRETGDGDVSPSDSEDEDEVEASIARPLKLVGSSSQYRALSVIASQPSSLYSASRNSQARFKRVDDSVNNLYGDSGAAFDDPSDDEDSDSNDEINLKTNHGMSHIPAARIAGAGK